MRLNRMAASMAVAVPFAFPFAFPFVVVVPAYAQQTLGVVTVSEPKLPQEQRTSNLATGTSGSVLETPFSVSTVPSERIREQSATTLQDALRNVPGVQADSGFNGSHTQFFSIRGAVPDSGTGSNRVLRDGVRLSNYPYTPGFVESVDVLRGPGAAIGVRSEPGGTVNITTKQPQMSNFGSALVGVGSHGAPETTFDINRVLSKDDELAARLIATQSNASKWRHVPDELTGLKLGLSKSDGNRYHLRLGVEATNQTYRPDYGLPAANGRPVDVPLDRQLGEPFGDSTTNNRIVDLHGDLALSAETRVALDLTHLDGHSTSIKNLLNGNPLAGQAAGTYARVSSWEPGTERSIDSAVTSLTTIENWAGVSHRLYFDISYYKETLNQPTLSVPASTSPSINVYNPVYGLVTAPPSNALPVSLTTQNLESTALSAQDQIDFGEWTFVGGLRYTQQKFLYGTAGVKAVDENRVSPKIAVLRRLSENDTIYANVATGISPNQVSSSSNQSLPSRRSGQAELGWKSLWNDGKVMTDLAVFQLDQKNMISSDLSTPLNNFDFTTSGSARSRGLEASLTGRLTSRTDVSVAYAYTDAAYLQNSNYGGKQVPNVARHALNLWAQYAWSDQWKTGAGIYTQSKRFADEANTTKLPGYSRVDLTQSWRTYLGNEQSFELQLALRNLFDKKYYVSSHLHVSRWITPAEGRSVYLTGTYRF